IRKGDYGKGAVRSRGPWPRRTSHRRDASTARASPRPRARGRAPGGCQRRPAQRSQRRRRHAHPVGSRQRQRAGRARSGLTHVHQGASGSRRRLFPAQFWRASGAVRRTWGSPSASLRTAFPAAKAVEPVPVHLKSLTLRGFKSFASSTTLRFEPGITCVVGPNGSGKSNVVDAIAWVLGEQGAKSLRGGKMEDVIFAGTAGRPALGRAELTLPHDTPDGALPIAYTEVSITRRMYRSGESEYEINGDKVRLLDVQELLSDSGIGREMHVIVGQGQLDAVLSGRPEDRRAFIEEAAGVLKHRKRKEKALRKLDGMQANLDRLGDLTAELRRQLKPLGKQAEVARRAAGVQADLRDARLRLLADDLVQLRDALDKDVADETAARERRAVVEAQLAEASRRESALETALAGDAPRLQTAQDTWYRLSALGERFRGVASLAAERHRHLSAAAPEAGTGRDPDQLDAEADRVAATEAELAAGLEAERGRLAATVAQRAELESALTEAERALVAAARALADRRE